MSNSYTYRGRHRAPTDTGKRIATVVAATAVSGVGATLIGGPVANAATTMPTALRAAIIACESGGRSIPTQIPGPYTASGLYQMTNGTWADNGGLKYAKRAYLATAEQQHAVANVLYSVRGTQPWNASKSCWSNKVKVGAVVKVVPKVSDTPRKTVTSGNAAKTTKATTGTTVRARVYVVKRGDTLARIAAKQGVKGGWRALQSANRSTIKNANLIYPGQKVTLS